jgi:hypothetical protein
MRLLSLIENILSQLGRFGRFRTLEILRTFSHGFFSEPGFIKCKIIIDTSLYEDGLCNRSVCLYVRMYVTTRDGTSAENFEIRISDIGGF